MTGDPNLPRYQHNIRVIAVGGDSTRQLKRVLTAIFQFMRAGELEEVPEGPHAVQSNEVLDALVITGQQVMTSEVVLETECPIHDLDGESRVIIVVSNARRVEE